MQETFFFILFLFLLFLSLYDSARTKQAYRLKNPTTKKRTKKTNKQRTGKTKQKSKKSRQRTRKSSSILEDPEPNIPQGLILDTLVTYDYKKKRFIQILNKNGNPTKRYPGGIFVQKLYGGHLQPRYEPVHKLPN